MSVLREDQATVSLVDSHCMQRGSQGLAYALTVFPWFTPFALVRVLTAVFSHYRP